MKTLFHASAVLSMLMVPLAHAASTSPYYGRWTVDEDKPVYTPRGLLYRSFDIAACGKDFCGVSVDKQGQCGLVLFRFLAKHDDGQTILSGHGKWGDARKNIQIEAYEGDKGKRMLEVYLGEGRDFGSRSASMPKFHATYRMIGKALCTARA